MVGNIYNICGCEKVFFCEHGKMGLRVYFKIGFVYLAGPKIRH